jgi:succinyl-diaminopimelate desuccinylase
VLGEKVLDRQAVRIDENYLVSVLKELISVPTVNPPGEKYEEMASVLERVLDDLGLSVEIIRVPDDIVVKYYPWAKGYPRFIVIARLGSGRPVLHFNGHYDVVPPGQGWSVDPFKPVIKDGKIYGRGSSDMKGGIAAVIAAVKALIDEGWRPEKGSIELAFTPDEEVGGETGVLYMLEKGLARPDYVIVAEPTTSSRIWIGSRGVVWARVKIHGKQAHGSAPWLGKNAFEAMSEIAVWLRRNYIPRLKERKTDLPMDDPRAAHPTLTMGGEVHGGAKTNIVPGYYEFSLDRRLIPGESPDDVAKELKEAVMRAARDTGILSEGFRVEVEVQGKASAVWVDPKHPFVEKLVSVIREVLGVEPARTICIGGLDTRYYQERGIAALTYGPGALDVAHMPDEYAPISELVNVAKVYGVLAKTLLS